MTRFAGFKRLSVLKSGETVDGLSIENEVVSKIEAFSQR